VWNATDATSISLEELRVSGRAPTSRNDSTVLDAFQLKRPADATTCVPKAPKREAAMTTRSAPTALGGEGHFRR
jgi:hypothetical protein